MWSTHSLYGAPENALGKNSDSALSGSLSCNVGSFVLSGSGCVNVVLPFQQES